ncbi:DUF6119 family protein [Streptacidiphilus fuscans]|uniref:TIGR04141 family sporadically distributed protein n=1 Tax=Streptacidiphilus fuscans TaxID=2789292 RepID=A0A931FG39_9ACTN|nr:DUF6119 family protein [Streptacidiphilus fuscans]MBF9072243.1 TIGR04141 family sporadically distributed protein [Streptacidiphilus fuscans]
MTHQPKQSKHRSRTRKSTLHRMATPNGQPIALRELVRSKYLDHPDYQVRDFTRPGVEGLLVNGGIPRDRADWCEAVENITGLPVSERNRSSAALLLLRTAQGLYALSYGVGQHMLDPTYRDDEFGLAFAIRCLDEDGILKIRNQVMDGRGRVDEYSVARGERIDGFGLDRFGTIVRRICGTVSTVPLTSLQSGTTRRVRVECAEATVKLPLATSLEEFLSDLRAIEDVCARPDPLADLRFVDRVRTLDQRGHKVQEARTRLETMLGELDGQRLALGIPESCQEGFGSAQAFRLRRAGRIIEVDELELPLLLEFVRDLPEGERLEALGQVQVMMFSDTDLTTPAGPATKGKEWLVADLPVGTERYFYGQGTWFEVGAGFLGTLEEELAQLFAKPTSVTLPPWPKGPRDSRNRDSHDEGWYNEQAAKQPGYQLFDKKNIVTEKFNGGGLEVCDLLGPDNQLICVKKAATGTAPLNHLFAQGVAAVETLRSDSKLRTKFLRQVAAHTPDHRMLQDFGSLRVVFGILLKEGEEITVDSLFAFAQVSLLQAARRLRAMNAEVEIVRITR